MFLHRTFDLSALIALSTALSLAPGKLIACAGARAEPLQGAALPTRLKLFNWGDNPSSTKGNFKVGQHTLKALSANQEALGFDRVALDYNHNSLPGHQNFQPDPRKVGGYGGLEVIEGEGVYLTALSYTPSGMENAREYQDLSPTVLLDEATGEVSFVHSVALCPQGEVKGLTFLSADFLVSQKTAMPPALKSSLIALSAIATIAELTGLKALSATSTDAEVEAFAKTLGEKAPGVKFVAVDEKKVESIPGLEALSALFKKQDERMDALIAKIETQEREIIQAGALREGKLIPLSAKDLSIEQFRNLVKELPANQVPMDQRTPEGLTALAASGVGSASNSVADEVCKNLGITRAQFDKHK